MHAPIVLFVFNRPEHTRKTLEALKENHLSNESVLFVFSDAPKEGKDIKKVKEVRKTVDNIEGFKNVHVKKRDQNYGLANNIINGVTEVINQFNAAIVLEDDLVTSPAFLTYMNHLLNFYNNHNKVFSITGFNYSKKILKIPSDYTYDVYFNPRPASWGWATWKNVWNKVDWEMKDFNNFKKDRKKQRAFNKTGADKTEMLFRQISGKIDSWAIRWDYHHFKKDGLCVYPIESYIQNIGLDGSGRHSQKTNKFFLKKLNKKTNLFLPQQVETNKEIIKNFKRVYNINKKLIVKRFINRLLNYRLLF
jgi:hypothetical protein